MYATAIDIFWNLLDWNDHSFDAINAVTDDGFSLSKEQQFHTTNKPLLCVQNIRLN